MPNHLRPAGGVGDRRVCGGHSNRNLKRNTEHVVRYRLQFDPAHMSDGVRPTVLPNWTIKRAGQDAADRGEYRQAAGAFAEACTIMASAIGPPLGERTHVWVFYRRILHHRRNRASTPHWNSDGSSRRRWHPETLMTRSEARRIAANIAKLLHRTLRVPLCSQEQ